MISTVRAIYQNGVLHPIEPVDLPENCPVEVDIRRIKEDAPPGSSQMSPGLAKVYEVLGERYDSGYTDTAQRHNEHQP